MDKYWTTEKPQVPGAYWVRGYNFDNEKESSLVEVDYLVESEHKPPDVVVNMYTDTANKNKTMWMYVKYLDNELEWYGPLVHANIFDEYLSGKKKEELKRVAQRS